MNDHLGAAALLQGVPRPKPEPVAEARRSVILVIGYPHSGIALSACALGLLGVDIADIAPPASPRLADKDCLDDGFWRRNQVRQFHERALALLDRDPDTPLYDLALPEGWWATPQLAPLTSEINVLLAERLKEGPFGFADPCAARLLPIWQQVFAKLNVTPRIVFCLRNPSEAIREYQQASGITTALAEYRWLVQVVDVFRYANGLDYCVVEYEDWIHAPATNLDKLQKLAGVGGLQGAANHDLVTARLATLMGSVAEPSGSAPCRPIVRSLYELARDPINSARLGEFVRQFTDFQRLHSPIEQALFETANQLADLGEDRDRRAAECDALGAELASIRRLLAERDAALARSDAELRASKLETTERDRIIARLQRRFDEADAALSAMRAERGHIEARLAQIEAAEASARAEIERHAQTSGALKEKLDEVRAVLTVTQARLAEARTTASQALARQEAAEAALAAARREADSARSAGEQRAAELQEALRGRDGRLTETEAELAALRAEREAGRAALAESAVIRNALEATLRSQRDDLASAQQLRDALNRELEGLRAAVRWAEEDGAATVARLRRELTEVRDQLTRQNGEKDALEARVATLAGDLAAARQAGRAAMRALAVPITPPAPEPISWGRAVRRIFGWAG